MEKYNLSRGWYILVSDDEMCLPVCVSEAGNQLDLKSDGPSRLKGLTKTRAFTTRHAACPHLKSGLFSENYQLQATSSLCNVNFS